ncbi:hypothetical protein E4U58_005587 [Claviceps cyperi]|nr:hypothetical protein E4U58_005587 [Claviceps cyperi]
MPDSSSAWRFSSNQRRINPPSPEVKLEDTMANDPLSIWCPELSEETQVSVLPSEPSPQTSPPAELPRNASLFSMILESEEESPLVMNLAGSPMDVPVDRKTGMNEAQKRRQRNAEASARSRKKRVLVRKQLEEAQKVIQGQNEMMKKKDDEIQTSNRSVKTEDAELENKHLTTLLEDEAVPEEMSYAPDATLLGATYDPIFHPFLTPDYYLTQDHCAADPTELYWDCIQSLYTQYE